jgi:hypothetical protein
MTKIICKFFICCVTIILIHLRVRYGGREAWFNLKIPRCLLRGFLFTSPWERSELSFSAVLGEVKYKISVFDPLGQNETSKMPLWLASGIVGFEKFFIVKRKVQKAFRRTKFLDQSY